MRPICTCHGEPMISNGNSAWLCGRKHRARRRSYNDTPRQKENMSERVRKRRARHYQERYDALKESLLNGTYQEKG